MKCAVLEVVSLRPLVEKRAVAGIAHSNDTKHRIVRYAGQPLPEIALAQPKVDMPGLLWMNRPENEPDARVPELAQLDAYFTAARKDPSLWPLWLKNWRKQARQFQMMPGCWRTKGRLNWRRRRIMPGLPNTFRVH